MPDRFDADALTAAWGTRAPVDDRAERVRLIGECAKALLDDRMPQRDAAVFLAGAIAEWLENGGDLARDFLRVTKPKSRHTAAFLWRQICDAHPDERQTIDRPSSSIASSDEGVDDAESR